MGRGYRTSNPYRTGQTPEWTTTAYDRLGRVSTVTAPDGAITGMTYLGAQTTLQDPAGKQRRTKVDALGRIALVEENPNLQDGKPMLTTSYTYDARGNLRSVGRSGRNRTFVYDPLGRLTLALNPEAASALSYSYDDAGNLTQKSDGRTTITWELDPNLNRPTRKVYSDGTTPTVTYGYDAGSNGKGRLTAVSAGGVSATAYTYNELGLPSCSVQTTNGVNYPFTYVYKKGGVLETMVYPSGRQVSDCYDAAGRVNAVKNGSTVSSDVYAAGVQYAPHNGISGMVLGNGVVETAVYNGRLQTTQIQAALGTALLTINNNYGGSTNNGNLLSQSITLPGASITQNYGYDPYNRLRTMTESGLPCSQTYVYDAVGNRALLSGSCVRDATLTPQTPNEQTVPFDVANHWAGAVYDPMNGNMLSVSGHSYAYDGENRLKQSAAPLGTATYHYDGEGRRVLKVAGTATVYVYDALGRLAAEYGGAGDSSGRQYLTADHLGSTRLVTNSAGVMKRYDYLPYGEQLYAGDGLRTAGMGYVGNPAADPQTRRFTGKERDAETGLDYFGARYFSGAQGRFTSPDPVIVTPARMQDPQRFNLYAYARNNPFKFIDPRGEDIEFANDTEEGRRRALALIARNLSAKEAANIGIRQNKSGAYEAYVIDKKAIGKGASDAYKQLTGLIGDHSIVADVGVIGGGLTATFKEGALGGLGPISSWSQYDSVFEPNPGSKHVNVLVTQGDLPGGSQVWCCNGKAVYQGVQPDFVTMWHELMGETLKYRAGHQNLRNNPALDSRTVIKIENEIRAVHGMNPKTGADHGETIITVHGKVH